MTLQQALEQWVEGRHISRESMRAVMTTVMTGEASQAQIGAILVALRMKGETIEEIAGAAEVMRGLLGADNVETDISPSMGAEDFSYMLEERPGAYIWLGSGPARADGMLHNARFDFNDEVLALGASYWAQLVETELPK